jgi:predicted enzyme related to lactoylglutathione lyase
MHLPTLLLGVLTLAVASATAQAPPASPTPTRVTTLGAVGIAVSSLQNSTKFYTEVLGLKDTGQRYHLPTFDEVVLALPGAHTGSAIVLMQYKQPKNIANLPIKLVFYVEDVKVQIEKIRKAGGKITLEPGSGVMGNVTIPTGFGTDPDGYALEINPLTLLKA